MTWKPIDTAPRDGRRLVIYTECAAYKVAIAFWDDNNEEWQDNADAGISYNPTHWDDLPAPPVDDTKEIEE